jgi:methylated-DNA-[protein]-cysteine S-methyltransferase
MADRVHAAWLTVAGPWGPIQLAATDRGLVGLSILATPEGFAVEMARHSDVIVDERDARGRDPAGVILADARRQLDQYFDGRRHDFDLPLDLRVRSDWDRLVLRGVAAIPFGSTAGYGEVARRIGRFGAARAVGGAVGRNPIGIIIPCHRVIAGDGGLGGYGGDWSGSHEMRLGVKRWLLELEGAPAGAFGRLASRRRTGGSRQDAFDSVAREPSIAG